MVSKEIIEKVREFIFQEEHSEAPVLFTAENVARLCYITKEEAAEALKALGR